MQGCEDGWVSSPLAASADSCYKFVTTQMASWAQAEGLCVEMGAHLTVLETVDELIWMKGYRTFLPELNQRSWVGGYKKGGKWVWKGQESDSEMQFTDWGVGEPNNSGGDENCLNLFGDHYNKVTRAFKWNDGNCEVKHNFICEKHQKQ